MARLRLVGIAFLGSIAMAACGGASGDGNGGPVPDGGSLDDCVTAEDCEGAEICNPVTNQCETGVGCQDENHAQCGNAAHCGPDGLCIPSDTGTPCGEDTNCIKNEGCLGGFCGCDGEQFIAENVPPNMLIVFDQSGSMDDPGGGGMSKLEIAQDAIGTLMTDFGTMIRFGLSRYPANNNNCTPGAIDVDIGDMTAAMITNTVNNSNANGSTPIGDTLNAHLNYAGLMDTTRENYILLITDGMDQCSSNDPEQRTMDHFNQGTKTYVIGFGNGVDSNALDDIAIAGGTPRGGAGDQYYQADDATELNMALDTIGGAVLSCVYQLGAVPGNGNIFVYFDGMLVGEDGTNGWSYDAATNTLTFTGASCDQLIDGDVTDLVIVHECPIDID